MITKNRKLSIIRVPFGLGAGQTGAEFGPDSLLDARLLKYLERLKFDVAVNQQVDGPEGTPAITDSKAKYLPEVLKACRSLADHVSEAAESEYFPLVLGGDHSIAIGTLAGLTRHYRNLGVIWFDAHSDLNTEDTSPSGNVHGMSLAVAIGRAGTSWTDLAWKGPHIRPEHLVLVGARDLDSGEKEFIREQGIACFTIHEIDRMGIEKVMREAVRIAGNSTDGVHLSFDVDSIDPLEAPGTGTPVRGGVSYREAHLAMELLYESGIVTSAEFVEVNPSLDVNGQTVRLAVELIGSLLGERIL